MRKLTFVCAAVLAAMLAAPAQAQPVSIVTTPTGSFTNSIGAAIAKIVAEKTKVRAVVQAQALQGMIPVNAGNAEFGLGNGFDTTFYALGLAEYEKDGKHDNLRQVATLFPYRVALFVRKDSPIKTIADLKGKRVSAGFNAQKTIARTISGLLANAGLTYNDVIPVLAPNVSRSAEDFIAGKTDVLFFALGSAPVKHADAAVGGLRVLEVDESPAAMARMEEIIPGAVLIDVKPDKNLDGVLKPMKVVGFNLVFYANKNVPDDTVYQVVKAIHESKDDLKKIFGAFNLFDPAKMAMPLKGIPFHPGAVKFYKEAGLMPK